MGTRLSRTRRVPGMLGQPLGRVLWAAPSVTGFGAQKPPATARGRCAKHFRRGLLWRKPDRRRSRSAHLVGRLELNDLVAGIAASRGPRTRGLSPPPLPCHPARLRPRSRRRRAGHAAGVPRRFTITAMTPLRGAETRGRAPHLRSALLSSHVLPRSQDPLRTGQRVRLRMDPSAPVN